MASRNAATSGICPASPAVASTMSERPNGSTVFARMPCGAPSIATTLASPATPALAAT
jgi:hypothetical protein